jgi:hypothetical protein
MKSRAACLAIFIAAATAGTFGASCSKVDVADCKFACGPGGFCPASMTCVGGVCAKPGVDCPNATLPDGSADTGEKPGGGTDADAGDGPADATEGGDGPADAGDGGDGPADAIEESDSPADVPAASPPELISVGPGLRLARNKTWKSPSITVCWEKSGHDEEKKWVQDAASDTWAAMSAVRFLGWADCGDQAANLRLQFADAGQTGKPVVGTDADNLSGGVRLLSNDSSLDACALPTRRDCVIAFAVHRLGHALGFIHVVGEEDDPATCPGATDGGAPDADAAAPEAPDEESVMTFCNTRGVLGTSRLGSRDIEAVATAYGLGPSHFVFQNRDWREVGTFDPAGKYSMGKGTSLRDIETPADIMVVGHNKTIFQYADVEGGRFDVGTIADSGDVALTDSATGVGSWRLIAAAQNGYFVAYAPDRSNGEVAVFRVNALGHFEGRVYTETHVSPVWPWTHLAGTPNGGVFFFVNTKDPSVHINDRGIGRVAKLTPTGQLEITDWDTNRWILYLPQYELVTSVGNAIALYQTARPGYGVGVGQLMGIDATGRFRTIGAISPPPAYVQSMLGSRNGVLYLFNEVRGAYNDLTARIGVVDSKGYRYVGSLEDVKAWEMMSAD